MKIPVTLAAFAFLAASPSASSQEVGTQLPFEFELEDFTQIPARSFDDLKGRAILVEFFAYW